MEPMEGLNAFLEKRPRRYRAIRNRMAEGMDPHYPFGPSSTKCPKCSAEYLPSQSVFCLQCGARLAKATQ